MLYSIMRFISWRVADVLLKIGELVIEKLELFQYWGVFHKLSFAPKP